MKVTLEGFDFKSDPCLGTLFDLLLQIRDQIKSRKMPSEENNPPRQLKSSFVRPYQIPGGPVEAAADDVGGVNGTVKPSVPTSYAETLLFHKSFYFQQRRGTLDLRGISRVDVDKIIREVDIDTLQGYLENITFSDVTGEDLALYSDETFVRLFQVN